MAGLPYETDDFAADALLFGGAGLVEAARGGHDLDAHAAEDELAAVFAGVDPPAGLGHTLEVGEDALAAAAVLELDHERLVRLALGLRDVVVTDVPLLLEDAGDLRLQLRVRHLRAIVQRLVGVADAREHVGDWISKHSLPPTTSSSSCRG